MVHLPKAIVFFLNTSELSYRFRRALMNLQRIFFLSITVFVAALLADTDPAGKLVVHFFGSATCEECHEVETLLLQPLAEKYGDRLELRIHDLETDSGLSSRQLWRSISALKIRHRKSFFCRIPFSSVMTIS